MGILDDVSKFMQLNGQLEVRSFPQKMLKFLNSHIHPK